MRQEPEMDVGAWPHGDSEVARLIRARDWTATPLGPIEAWPQSLKFALDMVLAMPGPATVLWGPAHVQFYNDAYIAVAQDRHPALLGQPVAEGWPEAYEAVSAPLLEDAYAGRATRLANLSVALRGPDGTVEERVFDFDCSPIRDEAGAVAGVLQTLVEFTARRRAEAAMRESEARRRLLQATWETDANGVVIADSPSWRRYTGQTLDEWLGYGWLDAVHPEDRAYAERQWREAIAARGLVDAEFRLRAPDGGWRWTNVRAAPVLDADGKIEKWAGLNIDIEARKRAEAALRRSEGRNAFLVRFSDAVRGVSHPALVAKEACRILSEQFGTARTLWAVIDRGTREYVSDWVVLADGTTGEPSRWPFDEREPFAAEHLAGRPVVYDDVALDTRIPDPVKAAMTERGLLAGIAVPVLVDGELVAVLNTSQSAPRRWNADEVAFVEALAQRAWMEIERARVEAALRASEERQAFLLALGDAMRLQPDAGGKIEVAAHRLGERLDASRVLWGEYDWNENLAHIFNGWFADGAQPFPTVMRLQDYEGEVLNDLRAGRTIRVDDVGALAEEPAYAAIAAVGVQALLSVPLVIDGTLKVNLSVHQHEARHWTDADVALVQEVAERLWAEVARTRAEAALRAREAQLRGVLDGMAEGFGLLAPDFTILEHNAEALRLDGRSREEVVGRSHWDVYPGSEHSEIGGVLKRAMAERVPASLEHRYMWENGRARWLDMRAYPTEDGALAVFWRDVTDRKEAEDALRESDERFRAIAEAIEDVFYMTDLDRNALVYLSPGYERVWGRPRAELEADLASFVDTLHPDDRPAFYAGKAAQERGEPLVTEYRIVRPDGAIRWVLDRSFPVSTASPRRSAGIASDITQRREAEERVRASEERLRQFGEASQDVLWIRDAATLQWQYLTPAFEAIYGVSREEALAGNNYRNWMELIAPEDRERVTEEIRRVRAGDHATFQYRIRRPSDGAVRWVRNTDFPITDADGVVVLIGGIGTDVTEHKKAEDTQRVLIAELQHRTRNLLGVVRSIASRTARSAESLERFEEEFRERLAALSRVQGLLSRDSSYSASLHDVIEGELKPYVDEGSGRVTIAGPPVHLSARAVQALTLGVHELTTNAVKYGALAGAGGTLSVTWNIENHGQPAVLVLRWTEQGVGRADEGTVRREGFGTYLLERLLPAELDARTQRSFAADGFRCEIQIPLDDGVQP